MSKILSIDDCNDCFYRTIDAFGRPDKCKKVGRKFSVGEGIAGVPDWCELNNFIIQDIARVNLKPDDRLVVNLKDQKHRKPHHIQTV